MADTQKDKAEAAAIRRRWITLGELLAVAAVVISGLTLWNSYQERSGAEAEKAAARQAQAAEAQTLLLRATPDAKGESLALVPADAEQTIQTQSVRFPAALGVAAVDTVAEPRIEAGWFAKPLLRLLDDQEGADSPGDKRLPVAITTSFVADGATHSDTALYYLGYRIEEGGLFDGARIRLRGLSLIARVPAKAAPARLDGLWKDASR